MDLKSALQNDEAKSALLSSARKEMYTALELFHSHVRYSIFLMLTLLTAVFGILGIVVKGEKVTISNIFIFKSVGGTVLSLLFPLGIISSVIISRYYRLYVASLLYAAELHESVGLDSQEWFETVKRERASLGKDATKDDIINKRSCGWPHTWLLYSYLIVHRPNDCFQRMPI